MKNISLFILSHFSPNAFKKFAPHPNNNNNNNNPPYLIQSKTKKYFLTFLI